MEEDYGEPSLAADLERPVFRKTMALRRSDTFRRDGRPLTDTSVTRLAVSSITGAFRAGRKKTVKLITALDPGE